MFLEPHFKGQRSGWIEVICGSMFSGKTEELIRRLKRAKIANQKVEIFKPKIDTRYDEAHVVSHDANSILSTPIEHSSKLLQLSEGVDVVAPLVPCPICSPSPNILPKYMPSARIAAISPPIPIAFLWKKTRFY